MELKGKQVEAFVKALDESEKMNKVKENDEVKSYMSFTKEELAEQEKYKKLFSEVIPEDFIDPTLFKYVDYCYYDCCEADDYYVKKDSFEEDI